MDIRIKTVFICKDFHFHFFFLNLRKQKEGKLVNWQTDCPDIKGIKKQQATELEYSCMKHKGEKNRYQNARYHFHTSPNPFYP